MLDEATGELTERRLDHENGEDPAFYRHLQGPVRVGIEATGPIHWFERLLAELGHELWIGDSAKIRASEVRKQKTDERDAALIRLFYTSSLTSPQTAFVEDVLAPSCKIEVCPNEA
jgi:transposase